MPFSQEEAIFLMTHSGLVDGYYGIPLIHPVRDGGPFYCYLFGRFEATLKRRYMGKLFETMSVPVN